MHNKSISVVCATIGCLLVGCAHTETSMTSNSQTPTEKDTIAPKPDAPLTANTHFAAGQVAESQGDLPRAVVQYEAAAKLDTKATGPLLRLGMAYTNLRQFDQAVTTWNRYIKLTGGSAGGYCNLGYTLELAQRNTQAEAAYKSAIAREPSNQTARVNYGLMLARADKLEAALVQLQKVLTPAEAHYNLASVLESEGKTEAAREQYGLALKLDPDLSDARSRLAGIN